MPLVEFCRNLIHQSFFDRAIIAIIILNGVVIGFETSPSLVAQFGHVFVMFNHIVLGIFILEAVLKIIAEFPRVDRYFKQGWNIFDFSIIILSLLPMAGEYAMIARLVRVLRITRLISAVPELRLIVATLLRSLPGMVHIVMLLGVLFYIYAVTGYYLFHSVDPSRWGNLGLSLLTLFGIVTLETWVDVMGAVLPSYPYAWIYFISFIVMGTFTFLNLFVAIVINNLSEAKKESLEELEAVTTKEELLKELGNAKEALVRLEAKLARKE